ncbi:MAG: hypothetical protein GY866_40205 [Proteobacteria bacterium]|nr:hypothetical protein [Pseudomonadota bacterium]
MPANEYLLDLLKDLIDHEVKFIICGGVAVVLHGVERLTMDLDLSVDMSENNLLKLLGVVEKNNMSPRAPIPAESLLDTGIINTITQEKGALVFTFIDNSNPFRQIDIFITKNMHYDTIIDDTEEILLEGNYKARIVSVDKLIDMKKEIEPERDKDISDIKALMKIRETTDGK